MGSLVVGLATVVIGVPPASRPPLPEPAGPVAAARVPPVAPDRVGRVIMVGNTRTTDRAVLQELPALRPGGPLPGEADLLRGEIRLLVKYHRRFDLDAGKRPAVEVLPATDGTMYRDIRVSFPERER